MSQSEGGPDQRPVSLGTRKVGFQVALSVQIPSSVETRDLSWSLKTFFFTINVSSA